MSNGAPPNGTITIVERATRVVRDVGFPIVVAGFLLYSLPPRLNAIVEAITENSRAVDRQTARCQALEDKIAIALHMAEDTNRLLHKRLKGDHAD